MNFQRRVAVGPVLMMEPILIHQDRLKEPAKRTRVIAVGETRPIRPAHIGRVVTDQSPVFATTRPELEVLDGAVPSNMIFETQHRGFRLAGQGIPVEHHSAA